MDNPHRGGRGSQGRFWVRDQGKGCHHNNKKSTQKKWGGIPKEHIWVQILFSHGLYT